MPAGKAIAIAAMPTAVLMGLGLTPTLASAKDNPAKFSADDYKACADAVEAGKDAENGADEKDKADASATPTPSPSASAGQDDADTSEDAGKSGSADKKAAEPTPEPSATASKDAGDDSKDEATPTPSPSKTTNPLDPLGVGDALKDLFTPKDKETAEPTPSPSASASKDAGDAVKDTVDGAGKAVEDTVDGVGKTVGDTADKAKDVTEGAADEVKDKATDAATPSPDATEVPDNCPVATDAEGADEDTPAQLPSESWKLEASSLLLKGADYKGLVDVRMADGSTKRVMKYIISNGTDIGDLHQISQGPDGKYFHIRADKGSTSTIRDGKTTMYTEELSGNLLGLIPMTFNAESPPPLNLPILYFTNVKVTQAAQFGGTLHVPGLHTTVEDS
ncbi:hypothetical protein [Streptomyces sp. SID5785]|uniref:hypothetical protein n=1 Tax=Streptomyces sp. SID5785 TaxID=2690309 RepID=UPI001F308257|nr:hypothetical protein [Streptomyces sp. SID5785]